MPNKVIIITSYKPSARAVLGNIGPRSWQYGPSARTKAMEGQHPPVRLDLARLVISLLYGTRAMLALNLPACESKKIHSMETVRMAKSRPRKTQSERLDLPRDYLYLLYRHECFTGRYTTRHIHAKPHPDSSGVFSISSLPCLRPAGGKFELTNRDSTGGKNFTVLTSLWVNRKGVEIKQLFSLKMALSFHKKRFTIAKTISDYKNWKIWNIFFSKLLIWPQKWEAGVRHGNSIVARPLSPGRINIF